MKETFFWSAKSFILLSTLLLIALFYWAHLTKIDEIVRASGRLIAADGLQTIQAADPGQIDKVHVHEGQTVSKGQLLVSMQNARANAGLEEAKSKVAALKVAIIRLHAEMFDEPLVFSQIFDAYPEFILNQKQLFLVRQRTLHEGIAALEASLRIAQQELAVVRPLLSSGDIGRGEVLRLEAHTVELRGQIVNLRNKYFQDAQAEMTKTEEELSSREQDLADRTEVMRNTEILAPVNGVVRNINILTSGANVNRGDVIMELVPNDGVLSFEAKLRSADVAFVHVGAPATIKLDAYDYSIYGMLQGEVDFVSPDALTEKNVRGEEVFYRVRVKVASNETHVRNMVLQPGMTGQIDIRTGKRTVLTYLTKPVTKTFKEALTER
ncbi:HlyD family efflux transporter periplasmic adaptor subunit [Citrobacter gillenii]|uniref:HlyD family efflux transporter periplasmic adaptor subunit n=1 Tax=Citrobacter gillenii TaxID=67828 RepID=A0ABD6M891_9ENTR|nr:HlyD family efflux transporter periplasmic adaptor subunit [Citrobacter gillenii]NTZ52940.1 HlyD family efflux transporter periplasmic adaptor subunit [Citrobacter gillenii]